ncbi:cytochrome P450 [Lipomyces tetrasporus]|uniref:Cytochrome P450 n=1 Tax=Lipomyces tetrasporus TaxID=54092 RepID=A0AAD7VSL2_9ASCO|nr:cytochrome P450 [Lipomyces tetrasporus]KAJ8099130.1 cytochrome P450 [Lipomyces tetrasporus]
MVSLKVIVSCAGLVVYVAHRTILKGASLGTLGLLWFFLLAAPWVLRALFRVLIYNNFLSPYGHLPQPSDKAHWFFGHAVHLYNEGFPGTCQLKWLEERPESSFIRYYGVFRVERLVPRSHAALQTILQTASYTFVKSNLARKSLALVLGDGLLNAEGDSHKRQRRLLMPAFSFGHIKSLTPVFLEKSLALSKRIAGILDGGAVVSDGKVAGPAEKIIDVDPLIHLTTLDVIFKAGFGTEFNALENEDHELVQAYRNVFTVRKVTTWLRIQVAMEILFGPGVIPTKRNLTVKASKKIIEKFATDLIREKQQKQKIASTFGKAASSTDKDILNILIEEGKGAWTEREIRNNLMTFLAAGHETTSSATTIALYLLSKNPDVQSKLRAEIREHIPEYASYRSGDNTDPLASLTYERIESMKYLNNVCRESLRLIPPVPVTTRQAAEDIMVDGVLVKKGTQIFIVITAINQLKSFWGEDANKFNPDRWDNLPPDALSPYSFLSFIQGPRSCIGRRFSEIEFKCLLIALVGRFEFAERNPGEDLKIRSAVTSKFVDGLSMKVKFVD